ncbi:MAG: DUF1801 domain-containing protein [Acidobacteriota bacterium]
MLPATQVQLATVFQHLKSILSKYSPPLEARTDLPSRYELYSNREVTVAGRKRKDMYFAGIIVQRGYVGFYLMPIYSHSELKAKVPERLRKLLKGKSCFHISEADPSVMRQVATLTKKGFELYQNFGWI